MRVAPYPPPIWSWPNVLSLDVAAIAVCWQRLAAHCLSTTLEPGADIVLALAVWLAYVGDRWLDSRHLSGDPACSYRHRFYQRHAPTLLPIWSVVFVTAVIYAWLTLAWQVWLLGLALTGCCLLYTSLQYTRRLPSWLPKELWVAFLFTAGVFFFPLATLPLTAGPCIACLLLYLLLLSACVLTACWEVPIDDQHGQPSWPRTYPGMPIIVRLALVVTVAAAVLWGVMTASALLQLWGLIISCCALALLALDQCRRLIPIETRRVLADTLLLGPALILTSL